MKKNYFLILIFALAMFIVACNTKKQQPKDGALQPSAASFFSLKPPGLIPELFAPDFVSTKDLEIEAVTSPNMEEFYFVRQKKGERPKLHLSKYVNGEWQDSEEKRPEGEVFISTDNQTMYLGNKYKERTASGWTVEKSLGEEFEQFPIMRLTASATNTYVFDERDSLGILRYSSLIDGKRMKPKAFSKQINTGFYTAHPFIAPDESYLIWDSERAGGYGGSDLYISFRQEDGTWGPPINLGKEINSKIDDAYASVTSDGKYLFFNRVELGKSIEESEANIFWVDAQVIEHLKRK